MNTINEYDLQFGLLALRMFFVEGQQLVDAINEWEDRADVQLSDVLIERGSMGVDECEMIKSMISEEAVDPSASAQAPESAQADATTNHPPTQKTAHSFDPAGTIETSHDTTLPDEGALPDSSSAQFRNLSGGRFQIEKSHAKGALGEVFVARDIDLRRDVALKQMLDHCATDAGNRARFVFEAEVTGSLEHPGVVPIYALGQNNDGRPYYAMRFIEGSTMEAAIETFHSEGFLGKNAVAMLMLRELLGQMISICQTMAYAHSRGIIHRDLKPANIMLGQFGETLVVDWGLAKVVGAVDAISPEPAETDRDHANKDQRNNLSQTQMGQACGTPQFMSPEQAMGRHDLIDPRSDIYSLGAMLYQILTGQAAFAGTRLSEVLDAVRAGKFAHPRQINSAIPKPLEAICLKAMAADPAARYQSAVAIANDLTNWLADQSVSAYSDPWTSKLSRWARRHRSVVGSAGLAGCVVIAVLIGSVAMLTQAYQTAERHRMQAHSTVNQFFTTVSEDTLLKKPGMENLRTELLGEALSYYRGFLAEESRGSLEREIGLTNYYVGRIIEDVDSPTDAIELYQKAAQAQRRLVAEQPDDQDLMAELASTLNAMGRAHDKQGHSTEALKLFKESMSIRKDLAAKWPEQVEYQRTYANSLMNLGLALGQQENFAEAIDLISQAQAIRGQEKSTGHSDLQITRDLAKGDYNLALIELTQNDLSAARQRLASASNHFEDLLDRNPNDLDDRYSLAVVKQLLANIELESAGLELAEPTYRQAIQALETLLFQIPGVPEYQYALANLHLSIGEQKRGQDAIDSLNRAKTILTNLRIHSPDDPRYSEDLIYIDELIQEATQLAATSQPTSPQEPRPQGPSPQGPSPQQRSEASETTSESVDGPPADRD